MKQEALWGDSVESPSPQGEEMSRKSVWVSQFIGVPSRWLRSAPYQTSGSASCGRFGTDSRARRLPSGRV
jgi:hypothetical protein